MILNAMEYDEKTPAKLREMIDIIMKETPKYEFTPDQLVVTADVQAELDLVEEKGYGALFKQYDKWIGEQEKEPHVAICIPSYDGDIKIQTYVAMMETFKPNYRNYWLTGHNIDYQRNQLVDAAMKWKEMTHIFFLDTDTVPTPETFMRLIMRDKPIVSGYYMMKMHPFAPLVIRRPKHVKTGKKSMNYFPKITEQMRNVLLPVDAVGGGCLMVRREVFEKIPQPHFKVTDLTTKGLKSSGEDLYFFDKAMDYGYQPYCDMSVVCDHIEGRAAYPSAINKGHVILGQASAERINQYNSAAILTGAGYDINEYNSLMDVEMQRRFKESQEKAEKDMKNKKPPLKEPVPTEGMKSGKKKGKRK